MKCLACSPTKRWESAEEFALAFRDVRQKQKAFGELKQLTSYENSSIDWSTDAIRYFETEDYSRAGQIARKEYESSKDPQAFLIMIKSLFKEERYFDCINAFNCHPEIMNQNDFLGRELRTWSLNVYLKTRHVIEAAQVLETCLEEDPDSPDLLFKKATILGLQARYKDSSEILLRLNRQYSNNPAILKRLSLVFEQLRDPGKAAAFMRAYMKIEFSNQQ